MTTLTDREETTTTTSEGRGVQTGHPERGNRTLTAIVIALAVALVGLSAWVIIDRTSTPATAPSDDIAQLLDDYTDAWNSYDGDAFLQLTTSDYTFVTEQGTATAAEQASEINLLGNYGWHATQVGERLMAGDGPWYVTQVDLVENATSNLGAGSTEGISVVTIVDDGGVLRVANHTFFGDL